MNQIFTKFIKNFDPTNSLKITELKHIMNLSSGSASFLTHYITADNYKLFNSVDLKVLEKNGYQVAERSYLTNHPIQYDLITNHTITEKHKISCHKCNDTKYYSVSKEKVETIQSKKLIRPKEKCFSCDGTKKVRCHNCHGHYYSHCSHCNNTGVYYDYHNNIKYYCNCSNCYKYNTNGSCKNPHCQDGYEYCNSCIDGYRNDDLYEDVTEHIKTTEEQVISCNCDDNNFEYHHKEKTLVEDNFSLFEIIEINIHNKIHQIILGKENFIHFTKSKPIQLQTKEIIYQYNFSFNEISIFENNTHICFVFDNHPDKIILIKR